MKLKTYWSPSWCCFASTSSVRSRRSQLGAAVLEEGEEAREGAVTPVETGAMAADGDGQTTPEIKLLEEVPEPQKPGPAAAKPAATNIEWVGLVVAMNKKRQ